MRMPETQVEIEALCRGLLQNAAARQLVFSRVEPEVASADYLTGFGAGWEAGQVASLALALSVLTGESPTTLIEDARAHAAMDLAFPFDVHVEAAS
jgi:hypothetical protein